MSPRPNSFTCRMRGPRQALGVRPDEPKDRLIGVIPKELMLQLPGVDVLRKLRAGEVPAPAISELIPLHLIEIEEGRVVFESEPGPQLYNSIGIVHGGYAMTLLDSCMGVAIYSKLDRKVGYTSIETKVNFTRPIKVETGTLHAVGTALHIGIRTATAEGRLIDLQGTLYAHGTTTCFLFPLDE